jgi:hypothetical protein
MPSGTSSPHRQPIDYKNFARPAPSGGKLLRIRTGKVPYGEVADFFCDRNFAIGPGYAPLSPLRFVHTFVLDGAAGGNLRRAPLPAASTFRSDGRHAPASGLSALSASFKRR